MFIQMNKLLNHNSNDAAFAAAACHYYPESVTHSVPNDTIFAKLLQINPLSR